MLAILTTYMETRLNSSALSKLLKSVSFKVCFGEGFEQDNFSINRKLRKSLNFSDPKGDKNEGFSPRDLHSPNFYT